MDPILGHLDIRDGQNKRAVIRVRNSTVQQYKIDRARKRKGMLDQLRLKNAPQQPLPACVEIYTPPPSPLADSGMMKVCEEMVWNIAPYIPSAFATNIWKSVSPLDPLELARYPGMKDGLSMIDIAINLFTAQAMLLDGNATSAQHISAKAEAHFESVIRCQDFRIVNELSGIMCKYMEDGTLQSCIPTIRRFSATAREALKSEHPLARTISSVESLLLEAGGDDMLLTQSLCMGMQRAFDAFQSALGRLHSQALSFELDYITHIVLPRNSEQALSTLRELVGQCMQASKDHDLNDTGLLDVQLRLASPLAHKSVGRLDEACDVVAEVDRRVYHRKIPQRYVAYYRGEAQYKLGWCRMKLGDVKLGEQHLRKAVALRLAAFGRGDRVGLLYLHRLRYRLKKQGKDKAAGKVQAHINAALNPDDTGIWAEEYTRLLRVVEKDRWSMVKYRKYFQRLS